MIKKGLKSKKWNFVAALAGVLLLFAAGLSAGQSDEGGPQGCSACEQESLIGEIDAESLAAGPATSESSIFEGAPDGVAESSKFGAAPAAVTLISPSGSIGNGNPTYVWNKVSGAEYYALEVKNSLGNSVIRQWFIGTETTGTETPSITLAAGTYTWRILAWNSDGYSWSSPSTFTVCSSTSLPGRAALISPRGTIGTARPTYQWRTVNAATRYHLKVVNINNPNTLIIDTWYDASDVVDGQNSYIKPDTALGAGSYKWWIQTGNCNAEGPWSNYATFRFANVSPSRPSAISPSGLISTNNPTFIWTAVKNAGGYYLQVDNATAKVFDLEFTAEEVTSGARAYARLPTALPDDDVDYYWMVRAYNDAGNGSWSSLKHFETICSSSSTSRRERHIAGR